MFCTVCGGLVASDDNFCRQCGKPLRRASGNGTSIGGNVTTGGGDFVGRDLLKRFKLSWGTQGCINIIIVQTSIVVFVILAATLADDLPRVITGGRGPTPIVLPTPVPSFTPVPTRTPTPTATPTPAPTPTFDASRFTLPPLLLDISSPDEFSQCGSDIISLFQAGIADCDDINRNWICYANVEVVLLPLQYRFQGLRDRRPLSVVDELFIDETGAVIMNLDIEGESSPRKIVAMADARLARKSFQLMGLGATQPQFTVPVNALWQPSCELPPGAVPLRIRSEDGQRHSIRINGVEAIVFE